MIKRLRRPIAFLLCLAALSACGNAPESEDYARPLAFVTKKFSPKAKAAPMLATLDAAGIATLRDALQKDGQPVILVANPVLKYLNLMVPFGQNGDVQTWSSPQYESVSLRDGVIVATRGFGADLMSSVGPSVAAIARGQGSYPRQYFYLDGGDQKAMFGVDCTLLAAGNESITVLGKAFNTRKVVETCTGPGLRLENLYWFDQGRNLRQSSQWIAPVLNNLTLQRVID